MNACCSVRELLSLVFLNGTSKLSGTFLFVNFMVSNLSNARSQKSSSSSSSKIF
jgi:hypothetical protein